MERCRYGVCRRAVNDYGVTGYEFQCRQDMTSTWCVCEKISQCIQVSMATGGRAHGLPLSSSGIACCLCFLRDGGRG